MRMADLRLLIVSSNPLARGGMGAMAGQMAGVQVVGSGAVADAAALAGELQPEAVLLDVGEGAIEDLADIARLSASQPGIPIVAVGGEPETVGQALASGASAL